MKTVFQGGGVNCIKRCQWAKRRMENWPKDLILEVNGILDKSRLRRVGVEKSKVEGD